MGKEERQPQVGGGGRQETQGDWGIEETEGPGRWGRERNRKA